MVLPWLTTWSPTPQSLAQRPVVGHFAGRVRCDTCNRVVPRSPTQSTVCGTSGGSYRDLPKYVVSTTLDEHALVEGWGDIRILRSVDDVGTLKDNEGGAIFIHGSSHLTQELADAGLVDRYNVLVFPVLLGAGKSVFSRAAAKDHHLSLRSTASYANGVVKMVYDVKSRWLPGIERDGLIAGLNWSGPRATGYDLTPGELREKLTA